MDIKGVRLVTVHDKEGSLIEVRAFFTAHQGDIRQALYAFDKEGTKEEEATSQKAIEKAKSLAQMKEQVKVVGRDSSAPIEHTAAPRAYSDIVSEKQKDKGLSTMIKIGTGYGGKGNQKFTVTMRVKLTKDERMVINVPFTGAPGGLADKVFHGKLHYLTEGYREVGAALGELYNIPVDY